MTTTSIAARVESNDMSLRDAWDALTAAGATVYAVVTDYPGCDDDGEETVTFAADGTDFIRLGDDKVICVSDVDGFAVVDFAVFDGRFVVKDELDAD